MLHPSSRLYPWGGSTTPPLVHILFAASNADGMSHSCGRFHLDASMYIRRDQSTFAALIPTVVLHCAGTPAAGRRVRYTSYLRLAAGTRRDEHVDAFDLTWIRMSFWIPCRGQTGFQLAFIHLVAGTGCARALLGTLVPCSRSHHAHLPRADGLAHYVIAPAFALNSQLRHMLK